MLALLAGIVQVPYVQTRLVGYLSDHLSELTGFSVSLTHVDIDWFDQVEIRGVEVVDPLGNPMINAPMIQVNYQLKVLFGDTDKALDNVYVANADVSLEKIRLNDSTITLNMTEFVRRLKALGKTKKGTSAPFSIGQVKLRNAVFRYNDVYKDSIDSGFDYSHFTVYGINGEFENLMAVADTFSVEVRSLQGKDSISSLQIDKMTSSFFYSSQAMKFNNLDLISGKTRIKDSVIFRYSAPADLSRFSARVRIEAYLNHSLLHSNELAEFVPYFKDMDEYYDITGNFNGRVSSFLFSNLDLRFGEGSVCRGKVRMVGLPYIDETSIDFDLVDSYAIITDLEKYLKKKTYNRLAPFDNIGFNAEFVGFLNDFVANGDFYTKYGRINSDINLKLDEDINKSYYKGALQMIDFNIGGYTENKIFQKVTLNGEIEGTGFTLEQANFELKGRIDSIGLNHYNYKNIQTDARFTKEFFEGFLNIDDPNLKMDLNGSIDIRGGIDFFNLRAQLDTAFLKPLNFTEDDFFIRSSLDVNAQGLKIDEILGSANFENTTIRRGEQQLDVGSLTVISDRDESIRNVFINSNLFRVDINGDFEFSNVYQDLKRLIFEYQLNLKNDAQALEDYYAQKKTDHPDYSLDYTVELKYIDPIAAVFVPGLHLSPNTKVEGNLTGGYTSILNIQSYIDTLQYNSDIFIHDDIQLNISKIADSTSVLAMAYVSSELQTLGGINTKDLFLEGIWNDKHIDFEFDINQVRYPNYARLTGAIDFLPNRTEIKFAPSDLHILDDKWVVEKNNLVAIEGREVSVRDLVVYHENQRISLNGTVSEDPAKNLTLVIDSLDIDNINSIIEKQLDGTLDGYVSISDYYKDLQLNSELDITRFTVNDFEVGDIRGENIWDGKKDRFDVNFYIQRLEEKALDIAGYYAPKLENGLQLEAQLNNTQLKTLEPFLESYFSQVEGSVKGFLKITGNLSNPVIRGDGEIVDGGVHINYLNTDYTFNGRFYMEKNKIGFSNMNLSDSRDNLGYLDGFISHTNFKDFFMDLSGSINKFMVLNTTAKDNTLFYGTGIATGDIRFYGPIQNMVITADATTERGTRIFIPIGNTGTIEKEDFINFVSLRDSTSQVDLLDTRVDLRGLNLDFDLHITPEAYCEIIFDIKAGDIIRGRGNGDLTLQIDTKGDFNMFGDYVIQEGGYNFTLYNIINKEFEILPNSKISWYGDPYEGVLDIAASYNQVATFLPLLESMDNRDYSSTPELRRNYPVQVLLDIDGRLLSPEVEFDIVAKNLPRNIQGQVVNEDGSITTTEGIDLEFRFMEFKNSIDEQELTRQVFSLIVLRRFSPLQSFNTGGSISSSVSELLSNQLSYWVTQVDENLEIDLNLGALDPEAFNTFQLRLSYTFLDGRLRVTRDGGFTNQQNKADVNSIAGDWTLEYLLTEDGKFKVKMYNRTNFNPINPNEETQNTITTGFSLIHTQSFDEIKELFQKSRSKAIEKQKNDPVPTVNKEGAAKNGDKPN